LTEHLDLMPPCRIECGVQKRWILRPPSSLAGIRGHTRRRGTTLPRKEVWMKIFLATVAICLAGSLVATPAFAVPPQHLDFSGSGTIELPDRCSFPVEFDYVSAEHGTAFYDQNGDLQLIGVQGSYFGTL